MAGSPVPDPIAITHVNVLPMTPAGTPLDDMTVTIRNGRIVSITATAGTRVPQGVRAIDGRGKWLMPGFSDMHMHLENDRMGRLHVGDPNLPDGTFGLEDALTPYLANGVLQVFSLASMSETIGQRVEVESGRVTGPHIATAAMIDGSPPMWPLGMTRAAATPADGRQAVRDAKAEGYDFIKVYSKLSLETFTAIVDEARQQHMRVVGHIPGAVRASRRNFSSRASISSRTRKNLRSTPIHRISAPSRVTWKWRSAMAPGWWRRCHSTSASSKRCAIRNRSSGGTSCGTCIRRLTTW